ncbi:hypothetical protein [Candidatus Accumulibacter sp. ACC007]|uniref:hypothetical protein n=1 Tax=Candidatus Accumulibacter sp. ACC007 TaxID=2823333 RepID=UPI0025B8F971|nr:hypothetical protein [Candidatus Accumulibacter sp. ACC007]
MAKAFAKKHGTVMRITDRQLSAAFEIGSLHALLRFYESQGYQLEPRNLNDKGEYRYLTSPAGNPSNFSWVEAVGPDGEFEIRQQVRVQSHTNEDIAFTPDIVVLIKGAVVEDSKREEYASGKRPFYRVRNSSVVAAHECKSMNPFPELMVSFIGMLVSAHEWYPDGERFKYTHDAGHLGPTLFVGGTARNLHLRMISAMQKAYCMNIICGLHEGTWSLTDAKNRLLLAGPVDATTAVTEDDLPF